MRGRVAFLALLVSVPLAAAGGNPADPMYTDTVAYANQARGAAHSGVAYGTSHALQIGVDGSNAARLAVRCFVFSSGDPAQDASCALGYVVAYPDSVYWHAEAVASVPEYVVFREAELALAFVENATEWPDAILEMLPLP